MSGVDPREAGTECRIPSRIWHCVRCLRLACVRTRASAPQYRERARTGRAPALGRPAPPSPEELDDGRAFPPPQPRGTRLYGVGVSAEGAPRSIQQPPASPRFVRRPQARPPPPPSARACPSSASPGQPRIRRPTSQAGTAADTPGLVTSTRAPWRRNRAQPRWVVPGLRRRRATTFRPKAALAESRGIGTGTRARGSVRETAAGRCPRARSRRRAPSGFARSHGPGPGSMERWLQAPGAGAGSVRWCPPSNRRARSLAPARTTSGPCRPRRRPERAGSGGGRRSRFRRGESDEGRRASSPRRRPSRSPRAGVRGGCLGH